MPSIWETLSAIDCSAHVEKKDKYDYLAWTWAWAMVKERYPEASYELQPDTTFPDGSVEVRVRVFIEDLAHTMWLPVLDFRNKPIQNPSAFDINTSRMRCLVKCLAMFGLGHYIYAGESTPQEPTPVVSDGVKERFYGALAKKDGFALMDLHAEVGQPVFDALFNAAEYGQKGKIKDATRDVWGKANRAIKDGIEHIEQLLCRAEVGEGTSDLITEAWSEMGPREQFYVLRGLTEPDRMNLAEHGIEVEAS